MSYDPFYNSYDLDGVRSPRNPEPFIAARRAILENLANGNISVDEAEENLESMQIPYQMDWETKAWKPDDYERFASERADVKPMLYSEGTKYCNDRKPVRRDWASYAEVLPGYLRLWLRMGGSFGKDGILFSSSEVTVCTSVLLRFEYKV